MKFKIFLDEAGRWPLAWPVVVGSFVKIQEFDSSFLQDSKKLTEKKREKAFQQIQQLEKQRKIIFSFWYATNNEIDQLWISKAINLATKRNLLALFNNYTTYFYNQITEKDWILDWDKILNIEKLNQLIKLALKENNLLDFDFSKIIEVFNQIEKLHWIIFDGNTDFWLSKDLKFKVITVIKWDSKVPYIGWASIIAKVIRDNRMKEISVKYPNYKLEKHKGYGTKLHRELIAKHGLSPIHRKSFCRKIIKIAEDHLFKI